MSTKNRPQKSVLRSSRRSPPATRSARPAPQRRRAGKSVDAHPHLRLVPNAPDAPSQQRGTQLVELLHRIALTSCNLAAGFDVTARTARREGVAEETAWLASMHRALSEEIAAEVVALGGARPRTKPTCAERLRWEWLASSGRLIDGVPDVRLVDECVRLQTDAEAATTALMSDRAACAEPSLRRVLAALQRTNAAAARLQPVLSDAR